ncbi:MAG: PAS domain S-box protein, partial [Desulfobulbaceae bacterium]
MRINKDRHEKSSDLRSRAEEIERIEALLLLEDIKDLSDEEIRRTLHELRVYQIELEMQNDQLRKSQVELEQLQARYFDIFEQAPIGYIIISDQEVIENANLTASTLLNTERSALIKQPIYRFILKEDRDIYYLHKKHLLETGDLQTFELRMTQKDEKIIWVHLTMIAIEESDGKPVNRIILRNITDRKRAEEALQESEQNFRTLSNSGMALIWTSGADKLCNYFNDVWIQFTGRTVQQEMGIGWTEGVYPDDLQQCLDIYTGAFDRREKFSMEYRMRRYDGEYRWILDEGCPRYDSKGEFIGYIGHCLDITERKLAEEAVRRNESRLRSLVDILQHPSDTVKDLLD